jgi:hypothetical protein
MQFQSDKHGGAVDVGVLRLLLAGSFPRDFSTERTCTPAPCRIAKLTIC